MEAEPAKCISVDSGLEDREVRFETLIERHHDEIYSYLWRLLRNAGWTNAETEAEDLTQDVFLRAYRAFARLRPDSNPRAWLYKIAANCANTALSRAARHLGDVTLSDEAPVLISAEPEPEQSATAEERWRATVQAIATLPPKQRMALVLRYGQELDYATIAKVLDCSQESARANVYQALRRLRKELKL